MQIAELQIFGELGGPAALLPDITDIEGAVITGEFDAEPWPGAGSPDGERIANLIDNNINTKYLVGTAVSWIDISTNRLSNATSYAITSANDAPERDPKSWELLGWDIDASAWVTIHTVEGQPSWEERYQTKTWSFENSAWYGKYRLNITAINGDQSLMQIAELQIFGELGDPITTSVKEFPSEYNLSNYPNPFNVSTFINFTIPKSSEVKIAVYDLHGRTVESLVNRKMNAGIHQIEWNASNHPTGIYFYTISINDARTTRKLIFYN